MQLAGRVAVVTGAGRGIGAAAAAKFVSMGARVAAIDLSIDDLNKTIRDAGWSDGQARAYGCDVSDEAAVIETFADCGRLRRAGPPFQQRWYHSRRAAAEGPGRQGRPANVPGAMAAGH